MYRMRLKWIVLAGLVALASCSGKRSDSTETKPERVVDVPRASADSAYHFVKKQVEFGPRVPNSATHQNAAAYFVETFKKYGAQVSVQEFQAKSFDGQKLNLKNIIASFYPEKQKRILLAAHWDTRPFADKDKEKPNAPFDGANDGASGVGVLLEIARVLKSAKAPDVGIDIILFDGEDWGEPEGAQSADQLPSGYKEWWCLGSQYWSMHKHKPGYSAYYGILLDMVGAHDAKFYREGTSLQFAPTVVERVWKRAAKLGYSHVFVPQNVQSILDDHYFVSSTGKIPMIDIIHHEPASSNFFGDFHHTRKDNMELISAQKLQIVADVVLNVVYYEE
jgi:glutaminyl-peptide cyclotransferase